MYGIGAKGQGGCYIVIFNSVDYLIFFPIVVLLYFLLPQKLRNFWLLLASYYFYMNWNAGYALLLLGSTLVTYLCGLLLDRLREKKRAAGMKLLLCVSFLLNLGILFVFKYADFFADNLGRLCAAGGYDVAIRRFDLVLPVGISFYIFQALGYTMDVYRGQARAEKNFFKYALFVSFFPQLVAGPIERSRNLLRQFDEKHTFEVERVRRGLLMMAWGLFMKVVIADNLSILVQAVYEDYLAYTGVEIVFATVLFAIQIYCDFGGYSYLAIGSAGVLGFTLMDNFKAPYTAGSVHDFWKRWHISLTTWFTDYLYIPLGGNRKGKLRKYLNVMIVFLVSGLWHGADWSFVVWGGLNGLYMVAEEATGPLRARLCKTLRVDKTGISYRFFAWLFTFSLIDFSWLFFCAEDMTAAIGMLRQIKANPGLYGLFFGFLEHFPIDVTTAVVLGLALLALVAFDVMLAQGRSLINEILKQGAAFRYLVYAMLLLTIMCFGVYGYEYAQTAFIYFQF